MNKTVPTARLCDTEAEKSAKLRRGAKLRPINKGNAYDISGRLRRLIRQIESGKHGEVTDVVLALRSIKESKSQVITAYYGFSQPEVLHYMASKLEKEVMG